MKSFKYVVSIVLILIIISMAYMYLANKPKESVPIRATLVFMQKNIVVNEVVL